VSFEDSKFSELPIMKIDSSFAQIASSVAASIAENRSSMDVGAVASTPASIRDSIRTAFEGLAKSGDQVGPPDSGMAPIEPFTAPPVPADALMRRLTEALQSFQEIHGGMQAIGGQQTPYGEGSMQAVSEAQHTAQLGDAQLGSTQQFGAGGTGSAQFGSGGAQLGSDQQFAENLGAAQLVSDKQSVANLGGMQLVSDKQVAANPGNMQLVSDKQSAANLGNMQLVSDKQSAANLGSMQLTSDQQSVWNFGSMQLASDQQRSGGDAGNAQLSGDLSGAQDAPTGPGLTMLNHCNQLFALVNQMVSTEKELKLGTNQAIR